MLRLAAGATMIQDHYACDFPRLGRAEIALHQTESEVDPRRHPGRGPDLTIGDEDAVHLYASIGIARLQFLGEHPMSCGPAPIKQPGIAQRESTDTDGSDPAIPF